MFNTLNRSYELMTSNVITPVAFMQSVKLSGTKINNEYTDIALRRINTEATKMNNIIRRLLYVILIMKPPRNYGHLGTVPNYITVNYRNM